MRRLGVECVFVRNDEVDEKRGEARTMQVLRHVAGAGTVPAAPGAMGEDDESDRMRGEEQIAGQLDVREGNADIGRQADIVPGMAGESHRTSWIELGGIERPARASSWPCLRHE